MGAGGSIPADEAAAKEAGRTDDEILAFFADRYGDEVLLDPPATGIGALAWLLPLLVAGGAVVGLGFAFTRWRHSGAEASGPRIEEVVPVGSRPAATSGEAAVEPRKKLILAAR